MRVDSAASVIPATAQADKYSVGTSDGVSVRMDMKTKSSTRHAATMYMF